jgi:hypothetical protein
MVSPSSFRKFLEQRLGRIKPEALLSFSGRSGSLNFAGRDGTNCASYPKTGQITEPWFGAAEYARRLLLV